MKNLYINNQTNTQKILPKQTKDLFQQCFRLLSEFIVKVLLKLLIRTLYNLFVELSQNYLWIYFKSKTYWYLHVCKVNEINGWYNMKYEQNESSSELEVGTFHG